MATSTTPALGIPYPTPGTGEPADGPTQMQAAFEHIDTTLADFDVVNAVKIAEGLIALGVELLDKVGTAPAAQPALRAIGTGANDAAAGNHGHNYSDLGGKPTLGTASAKASTEFASSTGGGREKKKAFTALTGTVTLDLSQASIHYNAADLTGNITLALANVPAATDEAIVVTIVVKQNATVRTVTMPAGVTWVPAAPSQAANKICVINLVSNDNGTSWIASGSVQG